MDKNENNNNNNKKIIEKETKEFIGVEWKEVSEQSRIFLNRLGKIYKENIFSSEIITNVKNYKENKENLSKRVEQLGKIYEEIDEDIRELDIKSINRSYGQLKKNQDSNYIVKNGIFIGSKIHEVKEMVDSIHNYKSENEKLAKKKKKYNLLKNRKKHISFGSYKTLHSDISLYSAVMSMSDKMTQQTLVAQNNYQQWLNLNFFNREIIYAFVLYDENFKPEKIIYKSEKDMAKILKNATRGEGSGHIALSNNDEFLEENTLTKLLPNLNLDDLEYENMMNKFRDVKENYDKAERIVQYLFDPSFLETAGKDLNKHDSLSGLLAGDIRGITEKIKILLDNSGSLINDISEEIKNKASISVAVKALSSGKFQTESIGPTIRFAVFAVNSKNLEWKGTDFVNDKDYTDIFEIIVNSNFTKKCALVKTEKELTEILEKELKDRN